MRWPRLLIITDVATYGERHSLERIEWWLGAAAAGSVCVQLRDRVLPPRRRLELARRLRLLTRRSGQVFAVNDRLDIAAWAEADGIHLPGSGVAAPDARRWLERHQSTAFLSGPCHALEELHATDFDAAVLSPIAAPRKGRSPLGLKGIEEARAVLDGRDCPPALYALGGMDASCAAEVLDAGADGVACIGSAFDPQRNEPLLDALGIAARR